MIEKLKGYTTDITMIRKIDELVGVVNALIKENNFHEKQIDALQMDFKQLKGAFIIRLDENDEPATATPVSSVLEVGND